METNPAVATHTATDAQFMALALRLAEQGRFTTSPNPNVGCVIVDEQHNIIGQGWHQQAGTPHAEVHALNHAGKKARGATVYVTLEPCSHHGRTPPCADALVKAGVKRVVAAMVDPNPKVAGRGLNILAEAGIQVSHGLLEHQARLLNRGFIKRMTTGSPFVTAKLAASIDGKTALVNGKSKWITGPQARADVQLHRAQSCAIVSGSGTVLADNPSLNVRADEIDTAGLSHVPDSWRQPLRVIIDGRNQLTADLQLFDLPGEILVVNRQHNPLLENTSAQQWQAPEKAGRIDLSAVCQHLGQLQVNQVWVEAGARLAGAMLKENLLDELILYQAPKLIGQGGRNLFDIADLQEMSEVQALEWQDVRRVGSDLKLTMQVKHP